MRGRPTLAAARPSVTGARREDRRRDYRATRLVCSRTVRCVLRGARVAGEALETSGHRVAAPVRLLTSVEQPARPQRFACAPCAANHVALYANAKFAPCDRPRFTPRARRTTLRSFDANTARTWPRLQRIASAARAVQASIAMQVGANPHGSIDAARQPAVGATHRLTGRVVREISAAPKMSVRHGADARNDGIDEDAPRNTHTIVFVVSSASNSKRSRLPTCKDMYSTCRALGNSDVSHAAPHRCERRRELVVLRNLLSHTHLTFTAVRPPRRPLRWTADVAMVARWLMVSAPPLPARALATWSARGGYVPLHVTGRAFVPHLLAT